MRPIRCVYSKLLVMSMLFGCGSAYAQTLQFTDQTVAAGLSCVHASDPLMPPQGMGAGGAVGDFNSDGWPDLFVLSGYNQPDKLFINNGNGTFSEQGAAWGVARVHRGVGVAVGDIDRDGRLDIYVTSDPVPGDPKTNVLYRNNGNGTFTDIASAAGVALAPGNTAGGGWGAALGDYDLDGNLDLAVSDWYRSPGGNRLYRNLGNGTFANVSTTAFNPAWLDVQGFSPRFIDMNGDRYPELLWVGDFGTSRYFVNNGNGTFTNATASAGVGLDGNGMGTSVADLNNDGRPDWFVTSIYDTVPQPNQPGTGNMLYMNQGSHVFSETSQPAGVKQGGWGWASIAEDLDNDGRVDLSHTNGFYDSGMHFDDDQSCVFRNLGNGTFSQEAPLCGVTHTGQGRGMVSLDYNRDGRMDMVIFTNDGPLTLYRNDTPGTNRWVIVQLTSQASTGIAPDGYGAKVSLINGSSVQHRWVCGGSNFLSQSELVAHFGVGSLAQIPKLRVEWPNGAVTERTGVSTNQALRMSSCSPDWNADGVRNVQDIFDFLNGWFLGTLYGGDFNASSTIDVQDIFDFLNAWFVGC